MNGQVDFTIVTEPGKIQGEKAGLKLIIEMARLKIPFQFTCTVTTRELIRKRPQIVEKMVTSVPKLISSCEWVEQKFLRGSISLWRL